LFAGSAFEYARCRQAVSIGVVASVTGGFFTLNAGSDVIVEESTPMVLGTMPIVPDHMYYNDIMEPMDRLRLAVRNPTGGAIVFRTIALITPI
jgi:hypothetical protein